MNRKTILLTKLQGQPAPARKQCRLALLVVLAACLLTPQAANGQQTRESLRIPMGGGYSDLHAGFMAAAVERDQAGAVKILVLSLPAAGPTPTPTSLLEPAPVPTPDESAEEPRLPLGVSSLIGAVLLALAYWLNKRGRAKERKL